MRRKEKEITNKEDIEKFLLESKICRLAMVDGDKPYMVPMNFGYRDGHLYFHSAKQGRKIDVIRKNPNVCFEVDQLIRFKKAKIACDWGAEYKSVIGSGRAEFLNTPDEKTQALKVIMSQYSDKEFEFSEDMLDKTLVIKVTVDQMTGKKA